MTPFPERQHLKHLIMAAVTAGARKSRACEVAGISIRTLQRWACDGDGELRQDLRPHALRPEPGNKLTEVERQQIITTCCKPEFANLPPSQIVPILADRGIYMASESSFYRVLKAAGLLRHRGRAMPKGSYPRPTSYSAKGPNQVWSWDISYLPTAVIGQHYYLYMIEDIYSRKIVGWEVHEKECGEYASTLLERSAWSEKCFRQSLVLHSDNGSPMKSLTLQAKMYDLGITGSRSRPRVSNDNPYSESLFRTLKYHPRWPSESFQSLEAARVWVRGFVRWYNLEHRHSRINFITPEQRHSGKDQEILQRRKDLYNSKQSKNPLRWSGETWNWSPAGDVELNPETNLKAA